MQLCLLLCLVLLSPQAAALRRHHSGVMKKRSKEPLPATTSAPAENDFVFDLYRAIAAANPSQNIFFSPLSISTTLAMVSLGTGSSSRQQILEALGISSQEDWEEAQLHTTYQTLLQELSQPRDSLQLKLGNVLFISPQVNIYETFLNAVKTLYLADTFPTNFRDPVKAQKMINDYVAKETKDNVVDLISSLDSTEVMVMVNYIFFKAKWESAFSRKNSRKQDFYVTPDKSVRVVMMRNEDYYRYLMDRSLSCQVVAVPYQGNTTALFILPIEGRMEQVENGLTEKTVKKWLKSFTKRQLSLYLPRLSLECSYELQNILPVMGIRDIFSSHADLSRMTDHSNIEVSEMVHKAVLKVDESGTEAAAATAAIFTFRSAQMITQRIMFNRPFLMLIVDNSTNILFVAKVNHP
ncbi:PREDICTED: plasma serine protease inhibitor [Condylura cristata]|uniref:plasma serine protease inhibitor n=1 Tax=Condylura cristata TaxID=143302 RepID=UPI000334745C|nr:PREDICTED: plasma serine protease inhibitor [Condylura cristata]